MDSCDIAAIISIAVMISIAFTLLAPVMPLELQRRSIDSSFTGVIFACISLPWIIVPLLVTKTCSAKVGRRNLLMIGVIILGAAECVYGLLYFIPISYKYTFVISSMVTRMMEGSGSALAYTIFLPLISINFASQRDKAVTARSCGSQFGKSIGFVLGGIAYTLLGYCWQFVLIGAVTALSSLIAFRFQEPQPLSQQSDQNQPTIGLCTLLKVKRTVLGLLNYGFLEAVFIIFEPILALKLSNDYHFSSIRISGVFTLALVNNVVGSLICMFLPNSLDKRKIILVTNLFVIIGLFLSGPSTLFHLPNSPILLVLGIGIATFSIGISKTLATVEAIRGGVAKYPDQSVSVSQGVSKLQNGLCGVIALLCPPLSSVLNQYYGFSRTIDGLALVIVAYYICLLIWTVPDVKCCGSRTNEAREEEEQGLLNKKESV